MAAGALSLSFNLRIHITIWLRSIQGFYGTLARETQLYAILESAQRPLLAATIILERLSSEL